MYGAMKRGGKTINGFSLILKGPILIEFINLIKNVPTDTEVLKL
jgi:hypothetical protein